MEILIKRRSRNREVLDGELYINGKKLCDTAENAQISIPPGTYRVSTYYCKQLARTVPMISSIKNCRNCNPKEDWNASSVLPKKCAMIRFGNGIYGCYDGSILIGKRIVSGCMKHSEQMFEELMTHIKSSQRRCRDIELTVEDFFNL